jgi:hypothetical protein
MALCSPLRRPTNDMTISSVYIYGTTRVLQRYHATISTAADPPRVAQTHTHPQPLNLLCLSFPPRESDAIGRHPARIIALLSLGLSGPSKTVCGPLSFLFVTCGIGIGIGIGIRAGETSNGRGDTSPKRLFTIGMRRRAVVALANLFSISLLALCKLPSPPHGAANITWHPHRMACKPGHI